MKQRQQVPPPWPEETEAAFIAASYTKRQALENQVASISLDRPPGGSRLAKLYRVCVAIATRIVSVVYAFFQQRF